MKKTELIEKAKNTKFKLNKHNMGARNMTRWKYVEEVLTPFSYKFNKIILTIQFEGEKGEYKINKKDYKDLESIAVDKYNEK